jgi:hypothetical protein
MDFTLFLILNGVLFLRPEELIPSIAGLQIYYWVICTNLIVTAPAVLRQLEGKELAKNPVTVCVLGVLVMIFLSHATKFDLWSARMGAFEFLKVVLYFLLLMSVVTTKKRLFWFLGAVVVLTLVLNTIAMLQYHGLIEIETLTTLMENDYDEETGERRLVPRMRATGIFGDPNDLSMIIVACEVICVAGLLAPRLGTARFALVAPIGYLVYALTLTQSRGGLLALLAGCGTIFYCRYGWQKSLLVSVLAIPAILAIGGRQTDIAGAMTGGTGAHRSELWSEGMLMIKSNPLFGVGYRMYSEEAGLVAHNSFVHSTAELGLIGGALYLGIFAISTIALWQLHQNRGEIQDASLRHCLPFVLALVVAYGVSMISLSRCYVVPTYLIAGVAAAYLRFLPQAGRFRLPKFDSLLVKRLAAAEVAMIVVTYLYIKVSVRL